MISTILWTVLAVTVTVGIGIGFRKSAAAAKAGDETPRALDQSAPAFDVALTCKVSGHTYAHYDTGWRCSICGNHVARREGELYGLVSEGRHERRREPR